MLSRKIKLAVVRDNQKATKQLFAGFTNLLLMGKGEGRTDTHRTAGTITTFIAVWSLILLLFTATIVGGSSAKGLTTTSYSDASSNGVSEIEASNGFGFQSNDAEIVQYFYEYLQEHDIEVQNVCIEERDAKSIVYVEMEETDTTTRFYDAEIATEAYVQGVGIYPEIFQPIDRVRLQWPTDGEFTKRTMFIPTLWVHEYLNDEYGWEELTAYVAGTESSYDGTYQPSEQATCYPDTESSEDSSSNSETESQSGVSEWNLIEGNESTIQSASSPSKASIVAKLLDAGIPVTKYRTANDDLQIQFESVDESSRKEHARQAALIFANETEQGYDETERLFMWWPRQTASIFDHMYIESIWVDKYLSGDWTKNEYIYRVFTTAGDS